MTISGTAARAHVLRRKGCGQEVSRLPPEGSGGDGRAVHHLGEGLDAEVLGHGVASRLADRVAGGGLDAGDAVARALGELREERLAAHRLGQRGEVLLELRDRHVGQVAPAQLQWRSGSGGGRRLPAIGCLAGGTAPAALAVDLGAARSRGLLLLLPQLLHQAKAHEGAHAHLVEMRRGEAR